MNASREVSSGCNFIDADFYKELLGDTSNNNGQSNMESFVAENTVENPFVSNGDGHEKSISNPFQVIDTHDIFADNDDDDDPMEISSQSDEENRLEPDEDDCEIVGAKIVSDLNANEFLQTPKNRTVAPTPNDGSHIESDDDGLEIISVVLATKKRPKPNNTPTTPKYNQMKLLLPKEPPLRHTPAVDHQVDTKPVVDHQFDAKPVVNQLMDTIPNVNHQFDTKPGVNHQADAKPAFMTASELKSMMNTKPNLSPAQRWSEMRSSELDTKSHVLAVSNAEVHPKSQGFSTALPDFAKADVTGSANGDADASNYEIPSLDDYYGDDDPEFRNRKTGGDYRLFDEPHPDLDVLFVSETSGAEKEATLLCGAGLEETPTPDDLETELMPHQRIALTFMLGRERSTQRRNNCCGGILADDQGLGKTLTTISLMCANKPMNAAPWRTLVVTPVSVLHQWKREIKGKLKESPKIAVYYGDNRSRLSLKTLAEADVVLTTYSTLQREFPGKGQMPVPLSLDQDDYDGRATTLFGLEWYRIVLDESQVIKNKGSLTSQACRALTGKRRWLLSGTPVQNSVDDLYSMLLFLRYPVPGVNSYRDWSEHYRRPIVSTASSREARTRAFQKLHTILKQIVLRRTKDVLFMNPTQDANGASSLAVLPPRILETRELDFSEEEASFYSALYESHRQAYQSIVSYGDEYLQSQMVHILLMLLNLRQACVHPRLVRKRLNALTPDQISEIGKSIRSGNSCLGRLRNDAARSIILDQWRDASDMGDMNATCLLCNNSIASMIRNELTADPGVVLPCAHTFCRSCLEHWTKETPECPQCRLRINSRSDLISIRQLRQEAMVTSLMESHGNKAVIVPQTSSVGLNRTESSKVKAVLEELDKIRKHDATEKTLVFSQWTSMLGILGEALRERSIAYQQVDGSMNANEREQALDLFCSDKAESCNVMLLSLTACGTGLNLVRASRVFILDYWWNPAVEEQAIDRAHRLGQTRPVLITRFKVRNSIEEQILVLQQKKRSMVQNLLDVTANSAAMPFKPGGGGLNARDIGILFREVAGQIQTNP